MSTWGTLDAEYRGMPRSNALTINSVRKGMPQGSEDGPSIHQASDGTVSAYGRLRDVEDICDSPAVLAWFAKQCEWAASTATLTWEIDNGPRYRYEFSEGTLRKLHGVLDL